MAKRLNNRVFVQLGMIGLERMGANLATRVLRGGAGGDENESFSARVIAALRNQFGGHAFKPETVGVR